ncbi:hypothetical protein [Tepidibacillus fermentans]|nr:hypothetical protein [Tepidibacillus fermentans]
MQDFYLAGELVIIFSIQEEVGLRGAKVTSANLEADRYIN